MTKDQALKAQNQPPIAALVGLHALRRNPVNTTTKPGRVVAVTEYWWRKWLPILGWARWFLVTMLRWIYLKQASPDGDDNGKGDGRVMHVEITGRELVGSLGMTEKELYRLLASEPIEGERRWRRLRTPSEGGYKQYEIQQVEALRLFIPRLRYLYRAVQAGKPPQRVGFVLEILMDDIPTPKDAEKLCAFVAELGFQEPGSDPLSADVGADDALNAESDTQGLNLDFGTNGRDGAPLNADFGTNGPLSSNFVTHACLHADNKEKKDEGFPPARQSRGLSIAALRDQYPVQPEGLDPDEAFNLALDRALALLSPKLRGRADVPFYTLAAELHQAALEYPSRTWPDAGGAGWVLDAVLDAIANGPVGSVNLIRAITARWLAEGNPYTVRLDAVDKPSPSSPFEQAITATWHAATGWELATDDLDRLTRLVGPRQEQTDLAGLLATIIELGRRVAQMTPDLVEAVVTGQKVMPPRRPDPLPVSPPPEIPVITQPPVPDDDPVLAQVTAWYLAEIGSRITPMVADDLRDLTRVQRDLVVWEYAFWKSRGAASSKIGRWSYITAVVHQPDMERINIWVENHKRTDQLPTRSRDSPGGGKHRGSGNRGQSGRRGRVVSLEEMPEVEPEEPLPLP
jgi:hypothetical protein